MFVEPNHFKRNLKTILSTIELAQGAQFRNGCISALKWLGTPDGEFAYNLNT